MTKSDWDLLLGQIEGGTCTPFLGAGASVPYIETGEPVARHLGRDQRVPAWDAGNLPRVAQYLALNLDGQLSDPSIPKQKMIDYLKTRPSPDCDDPDGVYSILASLPLPIYLTTNYDGFLTAALRHQRRNPRRVYCCWNKRLEARQQLEARRQGSAEDYEPSVANPLVYHMHGHEAVVDSLVITEDDYLDFMVNISQRSSLIPPVVLDAMTDNTLLFLGYSLNDWNFRVLFRALQNFTENSTRGGHVTVQLKPGSGEDGERAVRFFERYFQKQSIVVFWGDVKDFLMELRSEREAWLKSQRQTQPAAS
jgi:hypothetical protein